MKLISWGSAYQMTAQSRLDPHVCHACWSIPGRPARTGNAAFEVKGTTGGTGPVMTIHFQSFPH